MSVDLRRQVAANLSTLSTDELLAAWTANDRTEWSEMAFEVMAEILTGRGTGLPPQHEPVFERVDAEAAEPGAPAFYRPADVTQLIGLLHKFTPIAVASTILITIPSAMSLRGAVASYFVQNPQAHTIALIITLPVVAALVALQAALYYFGLKALAAVLGILMQMEANSRASEVAGQDVA